MEKCKNPWKENCGNTKVKLYIRYNGKLIPICDSCWLEIIKSNREW